MMLQSFFFSCAKSKWRHKHPQKIFQLESLIQGFYLDNMIALYYWVSWDLFHHLTTHNLVYAKRRPWFDSWEWQMFGWLLGDFLTPIHSKASYMKEIPSTLFSFMLLKLTNCKNEWQEKKVKKILTLHKLVSQGKKWEMLILFIGAVEFVIVKRKTNPNNLLMEFSPKDCLSYLSFTM